MALDTKDHMTLESCAAFVGTAVREAVGALRVTVGDFEESLDDLISAVMVGSAVQAAATLVASPHSGNTDLIEEYEWLLRVIKTEVRGEGS